MSRVTDRLRAAFGSALQERVPIAPYTWMRVGGPAEYLLEATRERELIHAFDAARKLGIPFTLLGGGSNVFADDDGLDGLVAINSVSAIEWDDVERTLEVSGGYDLDTLVGEVSARGWSDLTFAAGIPGTVGGGLVGGAGAYGKLLHEFVAYARLLRPTGDIESVPIEALGVRYRESDAMHRGDIVLGVEFRPLELAEAKLLSERIAEIKADRVRKHPGKELHCAGSFFKNLPPEEPGGWRIPAGKILDECGAKGMSVGGAAVFDRHANIIVNTGDATAGDINALADRLAATVRERTGVELLREVRYLSTKGGR